MPGGHSLGGPEVGEKLAGFGLLQGDWAQAPRAIAAQESGEQPLAEAAVRVIEEQPALFGGHFDRAPTSSRYAFAAEGPAAACHCRSMSRISCG